MFSQMHYLAACALSFYNRVYGADDAVLGFRNVMFALVIRQRKVPCLPYQTGLRRAEINNLIYNVLYDYGAKTDAMRAEFRATSSSVVRERVIIRIHYQMLSLFEQGEYACAARAAINHETMLFLAGRSVYDVHCAGKFTNAYIEKCTPDDQARLIRFSAANRSATWSMACGWCGRYQPQLLEFCDARCIAEYARARDASDEDSS